MRHKLVDLRNNIMRHITCVLSLFKCAAALCCACVTAAAMQTGFLQTQTAELHRSLRATGLMQIKTKTSTDDDATPVCSMFGLQPRQQDASFPRVIDCFLASNELDMLEIRLRELEQGKYAATIASCKTSATTCGYSSICCHSIMVHSAMACIKLRMHNFLGAE